MFDDFLDNADDLEHGELPPLPQETADDDHASPFSVALTTVAGMAGVRALRKAWHRRGDDDPAGSSVGEPAAREPEPAPPDPGPAPPEPDPVHAVAQRAERLAEERAALVELCIEVDDLLTSEALREKLRRGLRRVGVETVRPEGEPFDPEVHRAIGTDAAPDAASERTIARVERPGFRDGGVELRPPEVIVYTGETRDE